MLLFIMIDWNDVFCTVSVQYRFVSLISLLISLQKVDGQKFLSLTQADLMTLANKKFGPVLKVENLLALLKARMNPAQARFLSTIRKSS